MQCLALDESHIDVENVVDLAPVMNGNDVWLLQDCGRARLAQESGTECFVIGVSIGE